MYVMSFKIIKTSEERNLVEVVELAMHMDEGAVDEYYLGSSRIVAGQNE